MEPSQAAAVVSDRSLLTELGSSQISQADAVHADHEAAAELLIHDAPVVGGPVQPLLSQAPSLSGSPHSFGTNDRLRTASFSGQRPPMNPEIAPAPQVHPAPAQLLPTLPQPHLPQLHQTTPPFPAPHQHVRCLSSRPASFALESCALPLVLCQGLSRSHQSLRWGTASPESGGVGASPLRPTTPQPPLARLGSPCSRHPRRSRHRLVVAFTRHRWD